MQFLHGSITWLMIINIIFSPFAAMIILGVTGCLSHFASKLPPCVQGTTGITIPWQCGIWTWVSTIARRERYHCTTQQGIKTTNMASGCSVQHWRVYPLTGTGLRRTSRNFQQSVIPQRSLDACNACGFRKQAPVQWVVRRSPHSNTRGNRRRVGRFSRFLESRKLQVSHTLQWLQYQWYWSWQSSAIVSLFVFACLCLCTRQMVHVVSSSMGIALARGNLDHSRKSEALSNLFIDLTFFGGILWFSVVAGIWCGYNYWNRK